LEPQAVWLLLGGIMISDLVALSDANRLNELERLQRDTAIMGDFVGNVTGVWVKLGDNGEGIVSFSNKTYLTKPIGFLSIPAGTEVELSFANGIYYSKF